MITSIFNFDNFTLPSSAFCPLGCVPYLRPMVSGYMYKDRGQGVWRGIWGLMSRGLKGNLGFNVKGSEGESRV